MVNIFPIDNKYQSTNFKALHIASAENFAHGYPVNIDIHILRREDQKFLEKLPDAIDFKKLFPKISLEFQERWQQVFDYCMMKAESLGLYTTYVATYKNKICGITAYHDSCAPLCIDGICTIPADINRKVPLCGQTLMYQLFRDAKKSNANGITLDAITDGPFNAVKFYENLGFKKDISEGIFGYVPMSCTKQKVQEQLDKFARYITFMPKEAEKTDLMQFLD